MDLSVFELFNGLLRAKQNNFWNSLMKHHKFELLSLRNEAGPGGTTEIC